MSAEKRSASNSFGTSQLVKRQKSNVDLGNSKAVATSDSNAANGALVQAVSLCEMLSLPRSYERVLNNSMKGGRLMRRFDRCLERAVCKRLLWSLPVYPNQLLALDIYLGWY